jgi:hypothetical protein
VSLSSTSVQDAAEGLGLSLLLLQEGLSIGKQATISLLPLMLFVLLCHAEAYSHVPRSLSFSLATCAIARVGSHSIFMTMSAMIVCGTYSHTALSLQAGDGNIVTPLDLLMATAWHAQCDAASASSPLSFSGGSSVLQGQSFLPSQSPPIRHATPDFATPPLSQPRAASPFEGKILGGRSGSSRGGNVGHALMGLSRKVSVYDSSGVHLMACDCELAFHCAGCCIWPDVTRVAV